jgi:hypothetical protein
VIGPICKQEVRGSNPLGSTIILTVSTHPLTAWVVHRFGPPAIKGPRFARAVLPGGARLRRVRFAEAWVCWPEADGPGA